MYLGGLFLLQRGGWFMVTSQSEHEIPPSDSGSQLLLSSPFPQPLLLLAAFSIITGRSPHLLAVQLSSLLLTQLLEV
jgi:hypothetical protein